MTAAQMADAAGRAMAGAKAGGLGMKKPAELQLK